MANEVQIFTENIQVLSTPTPHTQIFAENAQIVQKPVTHVRMHEVNIQVLRSTADFIPSVSGIRIRARVMAG